MNPLCRAGEPRASRRTAERPDTPAATRHTWRNPRGSCAGIIASAHGKEPCGSFCEVASDGSITVTCPGG